MPLASFFMTLSHVSCAMRHAARNWTSCALAKAALWDFAGSLHYKSVLGPMAYCGEPAQRFRYAVIQGLADSRRQERTGGCCSGRIVDLL